jgi:NitT/TauT family transport system substrate-binding protein
MARLTQMASEVTQAYATKTPVNANALWNGSLLPTKAELNVLPPAKK